MKKFYFMALALMSSASSFAQLAEGNYYIQNVESGLFLGGANSWGTQASAITAGDECAVALAEGGYTITGTTLTSGNKTLGYNLYVDTNVSQNGNLWTIAPVAGEDGVYTIYGKGKKDNVEDAFEGYVAQSATAGAGEGYVLEPVAEITDAAKWRFVTKAERIAGIKAGDNISFVFGNPNFSRNHASSAWIVDEGCTNKNLGGGENSNFCAESYHSIFNIHQTITGVPNGTYSMTVQGFYRQDGEDVENLPVFYANGKEVVIPVKTGEENSMSDASRSFTKGLYTIEPVEFEVTDGTITIGVKNEANANLWCIWDNFQVTYVAPFVNTIEAGKYKISANVNLADGVTIDMVPAAFKDYVGEYTTTATLAGDESSLTISENAEEGLFAGFEISGDRVALSADKTITLGGKVFTVRTANEAETGSLAITATEDGYTMESASVYYNGKKVATVSDITIAAVEPDVTVSNMTLSVADDETIDEEGYFKVVFNFDGKIVNESIRDQVESFSGMVFSVVNFYVMDEKGDTISWIPEDIDLSMGVRNVYIPGLEEGKTYTVTTTPGEFGFMDFINFDNVALNVDATEYPTITFTVPVEPEVAGLSKDIFKKYYSNQTGDKLETPEAIGCDLNTGNIAAGGMIYGLSTVKWYAYADVTDYDYLAITVTEGTPRLMYNREIDPNQTPEADGVNHVEIVAESPYLEIVDNGDSKMFVYDLKAMAAANPAKPYVHINAIKAPFSAAVTVESLELVKGVNPATSISAVATPAAEATIEAIYSANGAKLATMQKGLNIVRYSNGATKKIMVK